MHLDIKKDGIIMKTPKIEQVKGDYWIFRNAKYVVLVGKKLLIFQVDGTFVVCREDIPNAFKVAFLPGDRLLTGGGKGAYHMLSLTDGTELWSITQQKRESSAEKFALSLDGVWAYDYYSWKDGLHFVRINLDRGEAEEYAVCPGLRSTTDIMCDKDGIPCLLQEHYANIAGEQISENGILYQYQDSFKPGSSFYWKCKWQFNGKRIARQFLGDTECVITNDLYVYNPKTGVGYYLLENDSAIHLPELEPVNCCIDYSGQYIVLMYNTVNIVVDWNARKAVACYVADYTKGCIVGNQFWVSSKNGILQKPFPSMEEIPL